MRGDSGDLEEWEVKLSDAYAVTDNNAKEALLDKS